MLGCGSHGYSELHTRVHRHDGIQSQRSVSLRDPHERNLQRLAHRDRRFLGSDPSHQHVRLRNVSIGLSHGGRSPKGGTGRERHQDRRRGSRPPVYRRGRNGLLRCTLHHFHGHIRRTCIAIATRRNHCHQFRGECRIEIGSEIVELAPTNLASSFSIYQRMPGHGSALN
jgi:hypothetical protein